MRFQTTGGQFVSAATKAEAAALAAQYGFGEIAGPAPAPAKPAKPAKSMSLEAARALCAAANDWPRCGQGWPATAKEREAAAVMAAAGECWGDWE